MIKQKTKFNQSEIEKIPEDWEVKRLEDIVITSSGGTPSRNKKKYYNGNIPWVKSGELKDNLIYDTEEKITDKGLKDSAAKLFSKGTLLVALYGATVGKTGILGIDATTNQAVCAILPKDDTINLKFLQYYIINKRKQLISKSSGGAQSNISQDIINFLKIPLPPFPQQRHIAEVINTVDNAIQKVDDVIASTERLKRGLMQELLTNGIEHERFKDTKIGRIPEEWEVMRLGDITKVTVGYVGSISKYYTTDVDGVPFLSTTNISENGIKLDELKYVQKVFHFKNKKSQVFSGDIIIARHGMSGTAATIPESLVESNCLNVVIVRSSNKFFSKFIEYLLNMESTRSRLVGWKSGSVQGVVNTKVLDKFKIPLPPLPEQHKIAKILSTIDKRLELERKRKAKLERIKKSLMNDLLTGKKRVKMD